MAWDILMDEAKAWQSKAKRLRRLAHVETDPQWARSLQHLADEAEKVAAAFEEVKLSSAAEYR